MKEIIQNNEDRVKVYKTKKELVDLKDEFMRKQEKLFFEELEIDAETEKERNKLFNDNTVEFKLYREFIININSI